MSSRFNRSGSTFATHTLGVDNIVEAQLGDKGVKLEEERERLADTTYCVRYCYCSLLAGVENRRHVSRKLRGPTHLPAAPQTTALTMTAALAQVDTL